jgi:hypothetical protein
VSDCCLTPTQQFFSYIMARTKLIFNEMIKAPSWIFVVLAQSADRHVAPLRHIIQIPSQPVFALSP